MPRAFTSEESVAIRERLKTVGTESFRRRGLRGTTVEGLAAAAGISKGAFYGFFPSKEALLLTLLDEHEKALHRQVAQAIRADPARGVESVITTALHADQDDPFVGIATSADGIALMRSMTPAQRAAVVGRDEAMVATVVAALAEAGLELREPVELVTGLLRGLVLLGRHRTEIGEPGAELMMTWLVPTLRAALLGPSDGAS